MHDSVMMFGRQVLGKEEVAGKEVLEVGSMDVNGSLRCHVEALAPLCYVGVDFLAGSGVDVVCDATDLVRNYGIHSFDVVISTEMLEHAEDWRAVVSSMKAVIRPGGLLLLTARSPGFHRHGYPYDWHRFTREDMTLIFADFELLRFEDDCEAPGVMVFARKPDQWNPVDLSQVHVAPADEVTAPLVTPLVTLQRD